MILLDTDIFSLLGTGNTHVHERVSRAEDTVALTVITWIEVIRGRSESVLKAADGDQLQAAQQRLRSSRQQLAALEVVDIDASAAQEFERLLAHKKLKKVRRGDLLIASIALAKNATLVTRNIKDFEQVPGLRLENWAD